MNRHLTYCLLFIGALLLALPDLHAQSLAQQKASERYEINAKRLGVDPNSEDALPRSREFKRIDSTYYVGWMFEGFYKYNHAADYLGFRNAAAPLERTLNLLERDYRRELATRTSDPMTFIGVYNYQLDYCYTAYNLMTCYSNMEDQDKVFQLLNRVKTWNFQGNFLDVYNYLGWTVHRNRFYTNATYAFLKNSIDENERLAHSYLDSGIRKVNRDAPLNRMMFGPGFEQQQKLSVYHYKSILYSYSFKIDSAAYYYNLLRQGNVLPHSNYATFRLICGDFREAEMEYRMEAANRNTDKRLQEWVYYSSLVDIYKGQPKTGIELTRGMIAANGSTPGFGWYNIAQARGRLYDGQNAEANRYINKAADFKELHIGTTLGQTHYDFSIQLLKLMHKLNQVEAQKFENKNWWYNIKVWGRLIQYQAEKFMQQFLIINQFAQNPERDRVIYKLFSTESTVSWDEVWYLIRDFSTGFFLDKFQKELKADERKNIRKYFKYFTGRLYMEKGNYTEANKLMNEILNDPTLDAEYERLFVARVLQAQAECAREQDNTNAYNDRMARMFRYYPQLIPYSGLKMNMQLHVSGNAPEAFIERLKDCNINWTTSASAQAPHVYLQFSNTGKLTYQVVDATGASIVAQQVFTYKRSDDAVALAYRLFNIGGKPPVPETDAERSTL